MKKIHRLTRKFFSRMFLVTILLTLFQTSLSAQQWKELHTGVTEDLYDVCCIDTSTVFVCGQNGVILKTTDGGESWVEKHRRPNCKMTKMCFTNPLIGYAFCDSAVSRYSHTWSLLKTEDGGETWQRTGVPCTSDFFIFSDDWISVLSTRYVCSEMALKGADTITVAISFDGVYRSLNGGASFEKATMEDFVPSDVRGFYLENDTGYLLFGNTHDSPTGIAKTEDGGETWHRINTVSDMAQTIVFAHFQNNNNIRVLGYFSADPYDPYSDFTLLDTPNGFETFEINYTHLVSSYIDPLMMLLPLEETYRKCCFTDSLNGVAFFVAKDMVSFWDLGYTEDNGASWTFYSHYSDLCNDRLFDVDGIDTVFYISGENGLVAKNQAFTLLHADEQFISFVNVYPNPMTDLLFIDCKEESKVTVFSITGQALFVKDLVSEAIDTSSFPSGLYLIRITDGQGRSTTKKVVKK